MWCVWISHWYILKWMKPGNEVIPFHTGIDGITDEIHTFMVNHLSVWLYGGFEKFTFGVFLPSNERIHYTARLLFELPQSSFVVASQYLPNWQCGYHIAGWNPCATHDEVPMELAAVVLSKCGTLKIVILLCTYTNYITVIKMFGYALQMKNVPCMMYRQPCLF